MKYDIVGPHYQAQSPLADAEQLVNWYPEIVESPAARRKLMLVPTPGLQFFARLGAFPTGVRGSYTTQGRLFKVAGTHLFELTAGGGVVDYGGFGGSNFIVDDGLPVTFADAGTVGGTYPSQLLIASGGAISVFSLASNTFQALTTPPTNVLMVEFLDGFFIALSTGNTWSVSNPEDATTWPGLSVAQVSVFSDQLLALKATNRILWVFGAKRAVGYFNSGAPIFPFDVANGAFMEVGIQAQYSVARVALASGTTVCWLGGDERGPNIVYAANGFIPQRVSDRSLEYWLSQQATTSDAVGFATQEQGHNFYWLWFPTSNVTWRLDLDLGMWHRISSQVNQAAAAYRARCHSSAFGVHLVGDRLSGNVYTMSNQFLAEQITVGGAATPIIRTRVGPTLSGETTQVPFPVNDFQVDFELGLGPQPPLVDGFGNPRSPEATFNFSEDYGKTWSPDAIVPCGRAGNFLNDPAIVRRLGTWRSFTARVRCSDPIPWRIVGAYVNGTQAPS